MTAFHWLASYPKSGNTWFRILVAHLFAKDAVPLDINALPTGFIASSRNLFDTVTMLDSGLLTHDEIDAIRPSVYAALSRAQDMPEINTSGLMKVHDAYTRLPDGRPLLGGKEAAKGAILIVRDPRAIAASLANHNGSGIGDAIEMINNPRGVWCNQLDRQHRQLRHWLLDWSGHVGSWLEQTELPVHVLRYEDLRTNTARCLREAMTFWGRNITLDEANMAAELSRFEVLSAQEKDRGFRGAILGRTFFRKGESDGWKRELSREQIVKIERSHGEMMKRLGYDLTTEG